MAYQRALQAKGVLVMRNEDLDPQRSKPEFAAAMLEDLRWLGIWWQEARMSAACTLPTSRAGGENFISMRGVG